jgi:hypothetical protein
VTGVADPWDLGSDQGLFVSALWGQSWFFSQAWEVRFLARATWRTQADAESRGEGVVQLLYYF